MKIHARRLAASGGFILTCAMAFSTIASQALAYGVDIGGPAQQSEYNETDYTGPNAGYLVLSLSVHDAEVGYNQFDLDAENADGTVRTVLPLRLKGLFREGHYDFQDPKVVGNVVVRGLRPGTYSLSRLLVLVGADCGHGGQSAHFDVPFTVAAGKVTYLGSYRFEPLYWANLFGAICSAGGYFVVGDEHVRDIETAKTKQPSLPADVTQALPNVAALNLPLFQSAPTPAPQPSSTAIHILKIFRNAHDDVYKDRAGAKQSLLEALKSGDLWQTDQALAHSWLGVIAIEDKDPKSAIAEYTEAIRLDPSIHAAWGDRGSARLRQGDLEGAFADMKMALHLSPRNALWNMDLGDIEMARKHADLAMIHYDDAIAITPNYAETYFRRSRANVLLKKYDAAIGDIDKGMKEGAIKDAIGHTARCILGVRAGHGADALADCDQAVAKNPKDEFALSIRGYMRLGAGQTGPAIEDFSAALAIKPKLALALYGRGTAKQKSGDAAGGKADIDDARAADPGIDKSAAGFVSPLPEQSVPAEIP